MQLRASLAKAGGKLESPSIEFGEDSDSILVENLLASVSQHQRQKNAEQTVNRMRAQTLNGYSCFQAPVEPSESVFDMMTAMFRDAWDQRLGQAHMRSDAARKEIGKLDKQIDALVDRIVDAGNDRVVKAYEARIAKMEREKLRLQETIENSHKPKHTFEDLFELAMSFLSSPWKIWNSGDYALKRIVLRLAFSERVAYSRSEGVRTPKKAYLFKALEVFQSGNCEMAHRGG